MKCMDMDINILNIMHIIQFKISDLPELLQRLIQIEKNKSSIAIVIIFVYLSQVLLANIYMLEYSAFKSLYLAVNRENCEQVTDVIA